MKRIEKGRENTTTINSPSSGQHKDKINSLSFNVEELRNRLMTPQGNDRKMRDIIVNHYHNPQTLISRKKQRPVDHESNDDELDQTIIDEPINLQIQHYETSHERRLQNYHKFLKKWDEHEERVHDYFERKEYAKYGSKSKADLARETEQEKAYQHVRGFLKDNDNFKPDENQFDNLKVIELAQSIQMNENDI